ncbi:MAG: hypothetical protein LBQ81_00220 [Zoogloeaceae bacterium]|nr:hypothetical protein [Zoogloeaceae bacterium]
MIQTISSIKNRQKGVVLVIGLILLMVVTLIALAGMRGVTLQERMAGNSYERNIAFQSAEMVLRFVEDKLMANAGAGDPTWESGKITTTEMSEATLKSSGAWSNFSTENSVKPTGAAKPPEYNIFDMSNGCYKVNGRGYGRSADTIVVLQSVVCRE